MVAEAARTDWGFSLIENMKKRRFHIQNF